jgi:flavodoxin-like protein
MTAVVVFESMFGNTQQIADAVSEGLAQHLRVDQVEVNAAPAVVGDDVELLVVGGPTHAFGLTRPGTRQSAAQQADNGLVSAGIGLREWLDTLPKGSSDVAVACFDTRVSRPRLPGSAAAAEKRLRRLGFRAVARSQSFFVEGTTGPLVRGERERARRWGEELAVGLGHHGGSADQPTSG